MNKPIIDLEELLDEIQDMIEEKMKATTIKTLSKF